MKQEYHCPCCGEFKQGPISPDGLKYILDGDVESRIVERLIEADGRLVSRQDLIDSAYGEDRPKNLQKALGGTLRFVRRKVERFGWQIITICGGHSKQQTSYKLVQADD